MVPRASAVIAFAFVAYCDLVVTYDDGLLCLWWWFIVNCDDGLLCLWHIIMPVMMVYCELWWFIMNREGPVIRDRLVKKGGLVALPSVTLGKEMRCRVSSQNTRRRGQFLLFWEPSLPSVLDLPSVFYLTLGKVTIKSGRCALVCWVYWAWHSAKCVNFAECFGLDTQQNL